MNDFIMDTEAYPYFVIEGKENVPSGFDGNNSSIYSESDAISSLLNQTKSAAVNPEVIAGFEKSLALEFLPEEVVQEGGVCFAQSPELQDAFKSHFTELNVKNYIYGMLHLPKYKEIHSHFLDKNLLRIPYPGKFQGSQNETVQAQNRFWELVNFGKKLRQVH